MLKALTARIDETVVEELKAMSKLSGKKQERIVEDALRAELKKLRAEQRK